MTEDRDFRPAAWLAAHPLAWRDRARRAARELSRPVREFLGRLALPPQPSHLKAAADFRAWQLDGDYLEFGVYMGKSFVPAYYTIRAADRARDRRRRTRFFAFDSFRGLPPSKGVDLVYKRYDAGAYAASEEEFRSNLARHGVDLKDVVTVPGFYAESLKPGTAERIGLEKVAIAYVDCDLYESTVPVLDFLTPVLEDGAILIFGDWYLFRANPGLGQQRAFAEWLAANPDWVASPFVTIPGVYHKSFQLHKKL